MPNCWPLTGVCNKAETSFANVVANVDGHRRDFDGQAHK